MHEQSLVKSLLKQVADLCHQRHTDLLPDAVISEVQVEIGPLSGVEPLLLTSAFEQLKMDSCVADAQLKIHQVPLRGYCTACQSELEISDFRFRCPKCAGNLQVTSGDGFYLVGISLSDNQVGSNLRSKPDAVDDDF